MKKHLSPLLVCPLLVSLGGCPDNDDETGYIADPYPDELGPDAPYCQWRTPPSAPEGTTAHPVGVARAFPPGVDSCEDIDASVVDMWLMAEIERQCDKPIEGFLRGCFAPGTTLDGPGCSFGAYYFSSCEVIIEKESRSE